MHSTYFLLANFQLVVTGLLAMVPFISATPSPTQPSHRSLRRGLQFRDPAIQQRDLPPGYGWSSLGCYTDDPAQRTLTSSGFTDSTVMTVEFCVSVCNNLQNIYAGIENNDCYCGNVLTAGSKSAPAEDCSTKCVGNTGETCGGNNRLSLYMKNGATPPPQPTIVKFIAGRSYQGCFRDSNDKRALSVQTSVDGGPDKNSVESCIGACERGGFVLAGMEFANQCWCDNHDTNLGDTIDETNCTLPCSGNNAEICGGANSLVVYHLQVQ